MLLSVIVVIFTILGYAPVGAWGPDGHKTVAQIANRLVKLQTLDKINALLALEHDVEGNQRFHSLVDIANWADEMTHYPNYQWSRCMHYIALEKEDNCQAHAKTVMEREGVYPTNCDSIHAVANYTHRLGDTNLDPLMRLEALKFLTHFMADETQPMHSGLRNDEAGNYITIVYDLTKSKPATSRSSRRDPRDRRPRQLQKQPGVEKIADEEEKNEDGKKETEVTTDNIPVTANLHYFWDTTMIKHYFSEHNNMTYLEFANSLLFDLAQKDRNSEKGIVQTAMERLWHEGTNPAKLGWDSIEESGPLACLHGYRNPNTGERIVNDDVLDRLYYENSMSVVKQRLTLGGVRLAVTLDYVFANPTVNEL